MRVINLIVVHCSATKADRDFTEQDLEVCHRRRGMNGPGYQQERGYKNNPSHRENRGACAWV